MGECKKERDNMEQCTGENVNKPDGSSEPKEKSNCKSDLEKPSFSFDQGLRIVEVLIIAVASLVVSIMNCRTADLEYKLNLANSKLHVEVHCDNTDLDDNGKPDTSILGVKYIDGIYEDFDIDSYTVITFTYEKKQNPGEKIIDGSKKINLLVRDYFFAGYGGGYEDYFYARLSENNWSKYCELSTYLLTEQDEYSIAFVDLSHYVIISYKNIIGKPDELGYKCGAGGRFGAVEADQIRSYIEEFEKSKSITLDDLEPESFMNIVKELISEQEEAETQQYQ